MNDTIALTNRNFTDDEEFHLMSPEGYFAAAVVLFLIGLFGFTFNLSVIVLIWKDKQLWTPLNVILFNLVVSDFMVSILGNPWTFVSAIVRRWVFGRLCCKLYAFIMAQLGINSITTLTVLALERYLIVSQPLRNFTLSLKGAYALVAGIWIYSLLLTSPPLFGWGDYVNEAADISCSVNWEEKSYNAMTYILYLFLFGLIIPVVVVTFSYINIVITMRRNAFAAGRVTKAESRVTCMIFIMIMAFLIAWSPYAILALLIQFGGSIDISPSVAVAPALFAKSSICYNPVIYVAMNTQFRQSWRKIFGRKSNTENSTALNETTCASRLVTKMTGESTANCTNRQIIWKEDAISVHKIGMLAEDKTVERELIRESSNDSPAKSETV